MRTAEARATALAAERERLVADMAAAEAELSDDDRRQREVGETLESLRARRAEIDLLLAERRMALEQLAERLAERYDLRHRGARRRRGRARPRRTRPGPRSCARAWSVSAT